jgi:hypothetical protein
MLRDPAPLALGFADLFDQLGTGDLCYSVAAQAFSGRDIAIEGFLSHAHGPRPTMLLVDQRRVPRLLAGSGRRYRAPWRVVPASRGG